MVKRATFWAISLAILLAVFLNACGGCPSGTREYAGECVPDSSDETPSNPFVPNDIPDQDDEIVIPRTTEPPRDYNSVPDEEIDLEEMDNVTVDLPEVDDTIVSMIVWAEGNPDNYIFPYSVKKPDGTVLYDLLGDIADGNLNDDYVLHYYPDFSTSIFLPNTPRISLDAGQWRLSLTSAKEGNRIQTQVFTKGPRPEDKPNDQLGVNIWFVGVDGLDENEDETAEFASCLSVFKRLYADVNITIDPIVYHTLGEAEIQSFGIIDNMDEYYDMMEISARAGNDWPNLFLIKGFGDMPGVLGMAAHIPGPPGLQGNPFSGVAVSMEYFDAYPRTMGMVLAHELGHWLGLFHPTEYTGTFFDTLDDTPECHANSADGNSDGMVDTGECASLGADNFMFWLVPDSDDFALGKPNGIHISEDQYKVLSLNPIIQYAE